MQFERDSNFGVIWEPSHPFAHVLSVTTFTLERQIPVVVTETKWPWSPEYWPCRHLQEKFADPERVDGNSASQQEYREGRSNPHPHSIVVTAFAFINVSQALLAALLWVSFVWLFICSAWPVVGAWQMFTFPLFPFKSCLSLTPSPSTHTHTHSLPSRSVMIIITSFPGQSRGQSPKWSSMSV